jgi:choline dehydrogenase-like flavoprotein
LVLSDELFWVHVSLPSQLLEGIWKEFKEQVRFLQPGFCQMSSICKVVARKVNYVSVDSGRLDTYGIPIPVIHVRFCDNDRKLYQDSIDRGKEILNAAKARSVILLNPKIGGFASHEAGTTQMGNDRGTSVLNSYCQAHDVQDLFVISGSAFTTIPEKNPTRTIMGLAVRAARYIASELKKGNLKASA